MKKLFLVILLIGCKDSSILPKKKTIEVQIKAVHQDNTVETSRLYKLT